MANPSTPPAWQKPTQSKVFSHDGLYMRDTLIYWPIHTLDRTKANPFPLELRTWYMEWDIVPDQVKNEILATLQADGPKSPELGVEGKPGDSETTLTFAGRDWRMQMMLMYRQYFRQRPDFDINACLQQPGTPLKRVIPVNLHEYFEDESGNPISIIDLYKFKTGEEFPVIPFRPESVLRLGPSPVCPERPATQDDSNMIAHFLETVGYVANSSWYRSPPALTFRTQDQDTQVDSSFPDTFETQGVLLALRQLYASDKIFNKALKSYLRVCGDEKKVGWVEQIKKAFDKYLEASGLFPVVAGVSVRELLDAFLYGSRIAHSHERDKQEVLARLIASHGRPQVIMAVHAAFRQLMNFALCVFPVVKRDYQHWLATGACPKRTDMSIDELLSSGKGEESKTGPKHQKPTGS